MPFEFNGYALDIERGELRCGDEPVHLQPKHLELLVYLIRNRDRVVSKKDIFDAVWPNVAVSEAAMSSAVRDLRIALADRDPHKWAIRTLPRRGFRFVADVVETSSGSPRHGPAAPSLYGRGPVLEQLRDAHERSLTGIPQLILLLGDPGMGKTACAAQAAREFRAAETSVHCAWCRTRPDSPSPSYWPWIQWLRSLQRGNHAAEGGRADSLLEDCLDQLWRDSEPVPAPRGVETQGTHRFRLFDAVTSRLQKLSEGAPLALFIDDLDAAPEASLELLEFALRQLSNSRLLVVASLRGGGLRSGSPLVGRLEEWLRHIQCTRVFLAPLGACDVQTWSSEAGCDVPRLDAREVAELTGGIPLWIQQWLAAAVAQGSKLRGTPRVVADLAAARLAQLSAESRTVLRAASELGSFGVDDLAAVAGMDESEVESALAQAQSRYVVTQPRDLESRFRFATPLYAQLLSVEVTSAERERARQVQRGIPQDSPAGAQVRVAPGL